MSYWKLRDKNQRSPGSPTICEFYNEFDCVLNTHATTEPHFTMDSSMEPGQVSFEAGMSEDSIQATVDSQQGEKTEEVERNKGWP